MIGWWLCWVPLAGATTYTGADLQGADLLLVDGDEVEGAFTNVGRFVVPAGAQVRVVPRVPLVVYADSVEVFGHLDADGSGFPGGAGALAGALDGALGLGFSPGEGGEDGYCVHGGGGGGGGHGGVGGTGGHYFGPQTGFGGLAFGTTRSPDDAPMGSGGGGGGSDCYHDAGAGADGGGSIVLAASQITVQGEVSANGADAEDPFTGWSGAGGGGSGGTVVVYTSALFGAGTITAHGGSGGTPPFGLGGYAGGGGGGAAGRVKLFSGSGIDFLSVSAFGGARGPDQAFLAVTSTNGADGTVFYVLADDDYDTDGVLLPVDNCPFTDNPTQDDGDGDGLGDACDPCPLDAAGDSDRDTVCDSDDVCVGFDDAIDGDGDGIPDACDACPLDNPDDSDGDGVCNGADVCDGDDRVDPDGDGVPSDCDLCPDVLDPGQIDSDGDGYGDPCDCAPSEPLAGGVTEEVCDGIDNDCDDLIDEEGAIGEQTFWADRDADGQGNVDVAVTACEAPPGFVDNIRDCDDTSSVIGPFAQEFCDGLDNDCDGVIDPPELQCGGDAGGKKGCGCTSGGSLPLGAVPLLLAGLLRRSRSRR